MTTFDRITERSMARARAINADAMPDVASIFHQQAATNAMLEAVVSYGEVPDATIPCRFRVVSRADESAFGESIEALRETLHLTATIRVAIDADIPHTARIVVLGQAYRVAVVAPVTAYSTAKYVGLRLES